MKRLTRFTLVSLAAIALIATAEAQARGARKQDEATRARGLFIDKNPKSDAMSILVEKIDDGLRVPVDPSTEFKAGDQIKIQLQSNFEGFIYVVNIQPSGKRCLMFPHPDAADNSVRPHERYDIPPGELTMRFDEEKGTEVLQVIMTRDRIPYLDAALKEPEGCFSQSASSAAAELQGGIAKKNVTPVVPPGEGASKVRSRDIILAPGKNKDVRGSVVAIPDNGGDGKLKSGDIAPFEIRLKHK
ncbi:MAG: hypothetical protein DMF60_20455 [Acidobacteria bacterium]|nr:MAG: hypothetical protein DMF60_20455 [Acidobacteriota bacterium]